MEQGSDLRELRDFGAYPKDPGPQDPRFLPLLLEKLGSRKGWGVVSKMEKSLLPKEGSLLAINQRFCGTLSEM